MDEIQLLLSSSTIFEDHNQYDCLHQSIIDLNDENSKDDVLELLINAQKYLENDIDIKLANDIFSLILKCYSCFPKDFIPTFIDLMKMSRVNSYYIVIISSVLSYYIQNNYSECFSEYHQFINDSLNEIIIQIQNFDKPEILIFQNEIPPAFKLNLLLNLTISSDLKVENCINLIKYLFLPKNIKFLLSNKNESSFLVHKIIKSGLIDIIIPLLPDDLKFYSFLNIEDLAVIIQLISNQAFVKIFPQIEEIFLKSTQLNLSFIETLYQKCDELNIQLKSFEKVFKVLTPKEITPQIINYSKKYNFYLPYRFAIKYNDYPDNQFIQKIFPKNLLEEIYHSSLDLTSSEYYINAFAILVENKDKITDNLIKNIVFIFHNNIKKEKFIEIIDEIIYYVFSSNQKMIEILIKFIDMLDKTYKKAYYQKNHINKLINSIMEMKSILPYSFMHLIDRHSVFRTITKQNLLNQDVNIRLYYIYKFSNKKANEIARYSLIDNDFEYQLKLRVLPPKSGFSIHMINFIKVKDLDLLSSIDEETLAFILKALIFGEVNKTIISGLTKEIILPFYAIAIQNWEKGHKYYNNHIFDDEQNKNLFLETLKSMINNQSIIIIESIKSILISFEKGKLINNFLDVKYKVIEILIDSILMGKCNKKKEFITSYLTSNIDCLKFVKSNLNDLINYYTKEKDLESILFIEKIQDRYDYFKENHLVKIPLEYFDGKTLKDFFPILEYKFANEKKFSINDFIFNKLINNALLRKCYLITRLQSYDNNNSITMNNLYTHARSDYLKYTNDFLKVFNSVYMYNSTKSNFVKKSSFNDDDLKSEFEIGRNIIDYLFNLIEQNQMKNKAFYCLKNIACSFLFLFDQNPNQIFEVVLPELENYSIIFNDKIGNGNKEIKTKAKTAICALSFLISSLHSNKVIDAFINWYFTNIEKFSDIQNYCFNYIFLLILKTNGLKRTIIASLLKYDYYYVVIFKLMKKDIENDIFSNNSNKLFYLILYELAISFNEFDEYDILAIDELKKMNSPFCFDFNNYITFLPLTIKQMPEEIFSIVPQTELHQKLFDYMENIEYIRYFWLNYKNKIEEADFFDYTYKSFKITTCFRCIDLNRDLELKDPISITFGRYIFKKSSWLYQCFTKNQNISLYQDEFDIFIQALDELNEYQNEDIIITEIDKCCSFQKYCCENYIFDISNLKSLSDKDFTYFCKLISNIINSKEDILSSLNILAKNFDIIYENDIKDEKEFNYFNRFLSILVEISNLDDFKQNFISVFGKNLFFMVLQPQYRSNEVILSKFADILINVDLPDALFCYEHVFDFMFLTNNDDIIYKAVKLSSKYTYKLIPKYNQKIRKCFTNLIKKTPLPLSKIIEFIKIDSSLADFYMNTILLDKLFNIDLSNNPNKNLIIQLINLLTPNITDYEVNIFTDNNELEINQNPPVPLLLLDINPIFWNYFIENRNKINKIIEDNNLTCFNENYVLNGDNSMISLTLFNNYPQLFSFAFKCKLFYEKINKEAHFDQTLHLLIDTENIVESSFDQLHLLDAENWKKNIKIQNIGENGIDLGGLRRSWFTKLSRALFNIDFGLFALTENMTYRPSIKSYSNSNYLQLFKFTGAFIARAILQKEYIDVELTHSFLCGILDYKEDIEDIREIDESVYNSLQFILENDLNEYEGLEIYFEIDHDNFGKHETFEFIENGSQIRVTNENKLKYVKCVINYFLFNSIECQLQKFYEGFDSLINFNYIKIFSPNELGLLISGRSEINVDKIKASATYEHPYTYDSPPVVLFFNSIEKWNQSDLAALMMFITGCPKAPVNGSVSINIQCGGDKTRLPGSRTCFNILFLPYYENEEELNLKFSIALRENTFSLQ